MVVGGIGVGGHKATDGSGERSGMKGLCLGNRVDGAHTDSNDTETEGDVAEHKRDAPRHQPGRRVYDQRAVQGRRAEGGRPELAAPGGHARALERDVL